MSATTVVRLPAPKEVRDLLTEVLRRDVRIRPGAPLAVGTGYPASVARYVDDALLLRAMIVLDLPLSARAGAALARVPPGGVADAISRGALSPLLATALDGALEELTVLFGVVPGGAQLRLYSAHLSGTTIPADAQARTQVLGSRLDLTVDVAGYGAGRCALILA